MKRTEPSRLEHAALFSVINQSRLVNGWTAAKAGELDPTIRVWFKVLTHFGVPPEHYDALYLRALDARQTYWQNGKEPPLMNAELLAAGWTGANGLRAEIERERIESKKYLSDTAESQCPRCFGLGTEFIYSKTGKSLGVRRNCQHQPLVEGEWLWKKIERPDTMSGLSDK